MRKRLDAGDTRGLRKIHDVLKTFAVVLDLLHAEVRREVRERAACASGPQTPEESFTENEATRHPFHVHTITPLRRFYANLMEALVEVDRAPTTGLFWSAAHAAGADGRRLAERPSERLGEGLEYWFAWHLDRIRSMMAMPALLSSEELRAFNWQINLETGPLSFRYVDVVRSGPTHAEWSFNLLDDLKMAPFWSFGLTDDARALRRRLAQFIITADQLAARVLESHNNGEHFRGHLQRTRARAEDVARLRDLWPSMTSSAKLGREADGSLTVLRVLTRLERIDPDWLTIPGFSEVNYARNLAAVLITLLEDAENYLVTPGTYAKLVAMASTLAAREFRSSAWDATRAELDRVLHRRHERALLAGAARPIDCKTLLGPDPDDYRAFRDEMTPR